MGSHSVSDGRLEGRRFRFGPAPTNPAAHGSHMWNWGTWATNWQRPTEPDGGSSQLGYRWAFVETGDLLVPRALAALGAGVESMLLEGCNQQPAERRRRKFRGVFDSSRNSELKSG